MKSAFRIWYMNYWSAVGFFDIMLTHKPEEPDESCLASQTCPNRQTDELISYVDYLHLGHL